MRVLMIGRSKSIAFEDLRKHWGEVDFARPPRIPIGAYDLVIAQEPTLRIGVAAWLAATVAARGVTLESPAGVAFSPDGPEAARGIYEPATNFESALEDTVAFFESALSRAEVLTPDSIINEGVQWAVSYTHLTLPTTERV